MPSLPRTPPTQRPRHDNENRFVKLPELVDTEWVEAYRPGGLHPVVIGDFLANGRYRIARKLGYGSHSTVWMAEDDKYYCLEVLSDCS